MSIRFVPCILSLHSVSILLQFCPFCPFYASSTSISALQYSVHSDFSSSTTAIILHSDFIPSIHSPHFLPLFPLHSVHLLQTRSVYLVSVFCFTRLYRPTSSPATSYAIESRSTIETSLCIVCLMGVMSW